MARILVIDDMFEVRKLLRRMLEADGHKVIEAQNGAVGIKECRKEPVDVVITDMIMPEKEGIETIREIKKEFSDVMIIAISGGGTIGAEGALSAAIRLGAHYAFHKPVNRSELINVIHEHLN